MKDELRSWLDRSGGEYKKRKAAAEKQVVRWEYATKEDRSVEPLYFERNDFARGRRLPKLPKPTKYGNIAYGLDAADRCVVERRYIGPRHCTERFLAWSDGALAWVLYEVDHRPALVCRATVEDGRIVGYVLRDTDGGLEKRFEYRDDGTVRVLESYLNDDGTPGGKSDEVVAIKVEEQKLDEVLPSVERWLIDEIPARVRALRLKQPAFSLIVAFAGKGNDMFPPTIGVGLERERQELAAKAIPHAEALWDATEYENYDTPKLKLDKKMAAPVNRAIARREAWATGYKSYARIAAALRKLDWRKIMPITDDFVLVAVDYDDSGLMKRLREAAGAKRFAAWKKRKWVR